MGQGGRDSGVAVPEQWGELPGDPGQGSGRGASSLHPARSTHPPARRTTAPPVQGAAPAAAGRPVTVGVITPFLDGSFWNPVLMG
ncbi:hypothetical protein WME98_21700 [Sorangium sp. So ce296]|uniref:hypothetical protein n=1 Tax=Sorangium sp. So ce296 TaxID=3133296 RepID=UPI003F5FEAA5